MKDYDLKIFYLIKRANVVSNAKSRKLTINLAYNLTSHEQLRRDFKKLELEVVPQVEGWVIVAIVVQPSLIDDVKASQMQDLTLER